MARFSKLPYPTVQINQEDLNALLVEPYSKETKQCISIKIDGNLFNKQLIEILISNSVNLIAEVNCSGTLYRKVFFIKDELLKEGKTAIEIDSDLIAGNYIVEIIAIATEKVKLIGSFTHHFGDIVAYLGEYKFNTDIACKGLIVFKENSDLKDPNFLYNDNVIQVELPSKLFEDYKNLRNHPLYKRLIVGQYAFTALLGAVGYLNEIEANEKENLAWFSELKVRWDDFKDTDDEFPNQKNKLLLVNEILNHPTSELMNYASKTIENAL